MNMNRFGLGILACLAMVMVLQLNGCSGCANCGECMTDCDGPVSATNSGSGSESDSGTDTGTETGMGDRECIDAVLHDEACDDLDEVDREECLRNLEAARQVDCR